MLWICNYYTYDSKFRSIISLVMNTKFKIEVWLLMCLVVFFTSAKKSYSGYQIWSIHVPDENSAKVLQGLSTTVDFWTNIRIGNEVQIFVEPERRSILDSKLHLENLSYNVVVQNVQDIVDEEERFLESRQGSFFETYHDSAEIQDFLFEIAANHSDAIMYHIGKSYEGRDMNVLKICENGVCGNNPALFIHCLIHAREWITGNACLYMINELTENRAANPDMRTGIDWYVLAPANPDGYAWTWKEERFWRTTRQPHVEGAGICFGVDPNRNFDIGFGGMGTSKDPCSLVFHGPEPFSEKNTNNIRNFVLSHPEIVYYQDIHACGQMVMFPYGYTYDDCADDAALQALCDEANADLYAVHNKTYECGSVIDVIYPASGVTVDWAYDGAGITNAFTIEARCGPPGQGHNPPESDILPNAQEIWAFHKVIARNMKTIDK